MSSMTLLSTVYLNMCCMFAIWGLRLHCYDLYAGFEYKNDSVVVVDKWGYYHCNASHPISVYNTGNTIINIEKPGPRYFVSGDHEHCKNGQRLLVEVIRVHQDSPAPSPFSSAASSSVFSNLVFIYMVLVTAASSIM